jgi:ribosomal protein S18 acetylase RimI-like enzyme
MHAWSVARLTDLVRARGEAQVRTMWILETDDVRRAWLEAEGFTPAAEGLFAFAQPLTGRVPVAAPPDAFSVRACRGEAELEARACAQHGAFQSKLEWGRYLDRFRRFMRSAVYDPERDRVAVAPDGRVAAFTITWHDHAVGDGLFEPVGTHPDFQRRGLGRAVITDALARMQAAGLRRALVCSATDNPAAVGLYQSCGFQIVGRLLTYQKDIAEE